MKTILVVEDNPLIMELVRTLLVSFGYEPIEAVDGNMAIELSKKNKFDIILLDIQLPGIDGTEVLKILKEDPATCEIPVIALTAHAMRGDEEKFLKAGCSGYVSKPIDIQRFRSIIAEFIA
ncbi:chemotaxis protein CheY [Methanosarcina sp. 2.H.T.1A.6]|uniref:response regulator n=1 Tax=unclassified Methanosarcina TaxID=2644672 RepID=UPI0006213AFD|nr:MULTISPECIES: response regulator [unclassified Methanosarcina]KKG18193.1 chemotaxis protein CheY [Methanosarcina sp. 2.H.T.1A.3]KKG19418.1 chemotaxis protein CheY [Methanosarcina sp. 2.H.T.1A.6]KKG25541.1 chemotaxis protein CheY [Methanosarcina sp. 2.H.T.1A.8]KKG26584.1 chemotaxis protein CheY [Methanosarcina sp. 2.H.T.1A.15]